MAYITELSTAFTLCMCSDTQCTPTCPICYSPRWSKGACVQQLWREHAASGEGKAAAQRFNDMIDTAPSLGDVKACVDGEMQWVAPEPPALSDAEIVERTIDFA